MEQSTRLAAYLIALAAGLCTLVVARNEQLAFRTGSACAVLVYTAGVIAMIQQNMVGVGLVLVTPCIMAVLTAMLPHEDASMEDEPDSGGSLDAQQPVPLPPRHTGGATHRLTAFASGALAALVLGCTAAAIIQGTASHSAGEGNQLATHRPSPYDAIADLGDRTVDLGLRGTENTFVVPAASAMAEEPAWQNPADPGP